MLNLLESYLNLRLLSEKIIHGCIKILLNSIYKFKDDKETLEINSELLCKLLATIGKMIDVSPQGKQLMDTYCLHIMKFSEDVNFAPRIRFAFQALLELRSSTWKPRREENAPKKISEVHADAMQRAFEEEYNLSVQQQQQQNNTNTNNSNTNTNSNANTNTTNPSSTSDNKQKNQSQSQSQSQQQSSTAPSLDNTKKTKTKKKKKKPAVVNKSEAVNDEDLEERISSLLRDYLSSLDYADAESSVKELKSSSSSTIAMSKLIEVGIVLSLEKDEKEREVIWKFYMTLFTNGVLFQDNFVQGFRTILESLKDLEVDIPFASKLVGKFIGQAVNDKCINPTYLEGIDEKVKTSMNEVINSNSNNNQKK